MSQSNTSNNFSTDVVDFDGIDGVQAEKGGEKFQKWMEMALEASDAGIWEWDIQENLVYWDKRTERTFGYEVGTSPITYEQYKNHLPEEDLKHLEESIKRAIEHNDRYQVSFRIQTRDGGVRWLEAYGSVVYEDGEPSRMIGVQTDITEKKRVDRALEVIRRCRKTLIRADSEQELLEDICQELIRTLGYKFAWVGEAIEKPEKVVEPIATSKSNHEYLDENEVHWGEDSRSEGPTGRAIRTGEPAVAQNIREDDRFEPWRDSALDHGFESSVSIPFQNENTFRTLNLYASDPYAFSDEELEWLNRLSEDVSARIESIRTQIELEETTISLEEKETLLEEIHHRVKNNMQIVSSIISLHDVESHKKTSSEIMQECQNRIQSMAMVHEMLYQSENLAEVSLSEYIQELTQTIVRFSQVPDDSVTVAFEIEPSLEISLSQAVPCGLILHELVSNACDHAFSKNRDNRLVVELQEERDEFILRVKDNGPGFPEDINFENGNFVGFDIVRALGEYEMDGELSVQSDPMTMVELSFTFDDVTG